MTTATSPLRPDPIFDFLREELDREVDVLQDFFHRGSFEEGESFPVEEINNVSTSILQADSSFDPSDGDEVQSDEAPHASSSSSVPAIDEDFRTSKGRSITTLTDEQKRERRRESNRLSAQASRERKRAQLEQSAAFKQTFFALGLNIGPQLQMFKKQFPECALDELPILEDLEECTPEEQQETFEKLQPIFANVITTAIEYKATQDAESAKVQRRIQALEAEIAQLKKQ